MRTKDRGIWHAMALTAAVVWGTTFVSTKVLLLHGLSPAGIMLARFALAYAAMLPFARRPFRAASWRDEALMLAAGASGGSLYFLAENSALLYTQASNVAIIISVTPLLTALAVRLFNRGERIGGRLALGSMLSLSGVALVVLNGNFVLHLNPRGDLLTLCAALSWAMYSVIVMRLQRRYSTLLITRKVFFYGILTLSPALALQPARGMLAALFDPVVAANLLFLGLGASLGCYLLWNAAVRRIGSVKASNYLYLNPLIALVTASLVLDETLTPAAIAGTALILGGVWVCQRGATRPAPGVELEGE